MAKPEDAAAGLALGRASLPMPDEGSTTLSQLALRLWANATEVDSALTEGKVPSARN